MPLPSLYAKTSRNVVSHCRASQKFHCGLLGPAGSVTQTAVSHYTAPIPRQRVERRNAYSEPSPNVDVTQPNCRALPRGDIVAYELSIAAQKDCEESKHCRSLIGCLRPMCCIPMEYSAVDGGGAQGDFGNAMLWCRFGTCRQAVSSSSCPRHFDDGFSSSRALLMDM